MVPQHVLPSADQSIHVPNFQFYAVWYTASDSWGADAIFTGWSNDLPEYILMDWITEYVHRTDIPSVDEFPLMLYSGQINERGSIPFPELQNFTNFDLMPRRNILEGWPVYRRMAEIDDMVMYTTEDDEEECKMERSFDNDLLYVPSAGVQESKGDSTMDDQRIYVHDIAQPLEAIYLPDDGDETKSLIWVQCRTCK